MNIYHKPTKIFSIQNNKNNRIKKHNLVDILNNTPVKKIALGLSSITMGALMLYGVTKTTKKYFKKSEIITEQAINKKIIEPVNDTKQDNTNNKIQYSSIDDKLSNNTNNNSYSVPYSNYHTKLKSKKVNDNSEIRRDRLANHNYKLGKLSNREFSIYKRSKPYIKTIIETEKIIGLDIKSLAGAESDFKPNVVSPRGAYGLMQITKSTVETTKKKMASDKKILYSLFDSRKVDQLKISNYTSDLENLELDSLGFKKQNFNKISKNHNLTEEDIKSIILPRYLKNKELFPNYTIDINRSKTDPHYNIKVGSSILLSEYLVLSSQRIVKDGNKYRYVTCSRAKLENYPQFQAFKINDSYAAYNAGQGHLLRICEEEAKKGRFGNLSKQYYLETQSHKNKIDQHKVAFNNLQRYGLLK